MTEGGIKVLLKPELSEVKRGTLRRSSIANTSSQHIADNLRRNSIGKSSSSNAKEEDSVPHHLRASTGSCHDFCKFGRKQEFEEKEKLPVPRRKPTTSIKQHIQVERKKIAANHLKVSLDSSDIRSSDAPEIIKREVKVEALSKHKPSDIKKTKEKNEMVMPLSTKSIALKPKGVKQTPVSEKKKLPSLLNTPVSPGVGRETDIIKMGKVTSVPFKKLRPTISLPTKSSVGRAITSITRKPLSAKISPPLKDQNRRVKTANTESGPEKTLHVVDTEIKNDDLKFVQILSPKALTDPSSSALSSRTEEEDTEESEYTDTESKDEIVNLDEAKPLKGSNDGNRRKGKVVISEDKGKSKFRRGKVIEVEGEKTGPRKLKFLRGRILGDNEVEKGDGRRRRFKKEIDKDASNDCSNNDEKVILRHQDSQEKKDSQGLFNNVIEETANKLAETRISKVKALVGAFETVISLQETSKPPTPTSTATATPTATPTATSSPCET